jgi:hypothetical protein
MPDGASQATSSLSAGFLADLMAGRVALAMDTVAVTEPFIRAGRIGLIASAYVGRGVRGVGLH